MNGLSRDPSALGAAFFTSLLSARFPGAEVASATLVELVEGTNKRARFDLSYSKGQGPPSVFVKAPGRLLNRLALSALGALDTEAKLAVGQARLPLEHAELLGGVVGRRCSGSIVLLEDLTTRRASPNVARTALSPAEVESGLSNLARLHGAYFSRPLPVELSFVSYWRLGRSWAAVSGPSLLRARQRLGRLGGRALPRAASVTLLERQFRRSALLAEAGPATVLHGDPHPGNSYRLASGQTGFYDWQLIRRGHFSHDVSYFLAGSLSVEDRRQHEKRLLGSYLESLAESGGRPPSFGQMWERYRAGPAFGLCTWLHTLSAGSFQETSDCLAMIERFASAYEDLGTESAI